MEERERRGAKSHRGRKDKRVEVVKRAREAERKRERERSRKERRKETEEVGERGGRGGERETEREREKTSLREHLAVSVLVQTNSTSGSTGDLGEKFLGCRCLSQKLTFDA